MADVLKQAGHRLTGPRLAVLEAIESGDGPLSPGEVLERGRQTYPELGRATVYRTLDLLTDLGMLRPVFLGDGGTRVVAVRDGYHHLLCLRCGAAVCFDECVVTDLAATLSERLGFQVKSHLLELFGLCASCRTDQSEVAR